MHNICNITVDHIRRKLVGITAQGNNVCRTVIKISFYVQVKWLSAAQFWIIFSFVTMVISKFNV